MKSLGIAALALVVAAGGASYAASSDESAAIPVKVVYGDLDLAKAHDVARLLRRIDSAATEACGAWVSSNPIDVEVAHDSDCHRAAVRRAVAQIDAPALSALYGHRAALAANGR
jgi:UrcA family protein